MKNLKLILITIGIMILAYAIINAIFIFAWMIKVGIVAGIATLFVIGYFKAKKWFNGNNQ